MSTRRKATMACEECRRRRAKCNGARPCEHCARHAIDCIYDTRRQRRGPKPRSQQLNGNPVVNSAHATSPEGAAEEPAEIEQSPDATDPRLWIDDLKVCLTSLDEQCDDAETVGLICHLIELFFTHVVVQQPPLLSPGVYFDRLKSGKKAVGHLSLAMAAASARYLGHGAVRTALGHSKGALFARGARISLIDPMNRDVMDRIQTLCLLALYEVQSANGAQAWCDLALAHAHIQMLGTARNEEPTPSEAVLAAMNFVRTMQLMHAVGNPRLALDETSNPPFRLPSSDEHSRLSGLLELLLNVQSFAKTSLSPDGRSHWLPESPFSKLQLKLDEYAVQQLEDAHLTQQKLQQNTDAGRIELIHCTFLWHICVLVLNRVFLPIRCGGENNPSSTELATYPGAPAHFLSERRNACEAAASTISSICHEVVIKETFFPACNPYLAVDVSMCADWREKTAIIGYSCYQSSLVLFDQLYRNSPRDRGRVLDNLKVNFSILGAMRHAYLPTENWIDTLLKTQGSNSARVSEPSAQSFEHYFARFPGLVEPPLVALSPSLLEKPLAPKETAPRQASPERRLPQPSAQLGAWKDLYSRRLNEQIAALGEAEAVDEEVLDLSNNPIPVASGPQSQDGLVDRLESETGDTNILLPIQEHIHSQPPARSTQLVSQISPNPGGIWSPPNQSLPELLPHDFSDDPVFANTSNLGFRYDDMSSCMGDVTFAGDFDMEAVLLHHLHHGELWSGAQFSASAQMASDPAHWRGSIDEQM